jgi:hypothetical protein
VRTTTLLAASLLLLVACGGAEPQPTTAPSTQASSAPAAVASAPAPAGPARRAPPEELRRYWVAGDSPKVMLYMDLGGLLHTELGSSVVPAALKLASSTLSADEMQCARSWLDGMRELVVAGDGEDEMLAVARVDDKTLNLSQCISASGGEPTQLEGAREAYKLKNSTWVHEPGFVLMGRPAPLKRALAQTAATKPFPASLSLGPDEYLSFSVTPEEGFHFEGTLLASSARFRIGVQADLPAPIAARAEKEFRAVKAMGGIPGLGGAQERELLTKLLAAVDLKRDGGHLDAAFDLHEPVADQARDLGAVASLGISSVRTYLSKSKQAEARNAVGQIAKDYAAWWEKEDGKPRARKRLVSFPAVPKAVPKGVKYQSTPADWKPWSPIKFEMDAPQYYQYEVKAAKDGESAEIIARGDLDGDGQPSQFKVGLHVDRKKGDVLVIDPSIAESDPNE